MFKFKWECDDIAAHHEGVVQAESIYKALAKIGAALERKKNRLDEAEPGCLKIELTSNDED